MHICYGGESATSSTRSAIWRPHVDPFLCDLRELLFQSLLCEERIVVSKMKWTTVTGQKVAEVAKGKWRAEGSSRSSVLDTGGENTG